MPLQSVAFFLQIGITFLLKLFLGVTEEKAFALSIPAKERTHSQTYLTEKASLNRRVTGSMMKVKIDFLRVTISPLAAIPGVKATS
ncbi:hypothetical protein NIES2098_11390 [Calothrix sp. NIES-2098]|nr:hypothetical protein NIES2098_11390 [Calothrix sp. NIES-2098]